MGEHMTRSDAIFQRSRRALARHYGPAALHDLDILDVTTAAIEHHAPACASDADLLAAVLVEIARATVAGRIVH